MSSNEDSGQSTGFTGHTVVDTQMHKIGTVTDVLYDEVRETPRWAVVKTGPLSGEHFMPLDNAYVDNDGRVVASVDKATVQHAPRPRHDHVIDRDASEQLHGYYGVDV